MSKEKWQGAEGFSPEDDSKPMYKSPEPRYRVIKGPIGERFSNSFSPEKQQESPSSVAHSETINYSPESWRMLQEIERLSGEGHGEAIRSALRLYYEKLLQTSKSEG